jgi:hypothetical protein
MVFAYLGDQSLPFLYELENDPELIGALKDWIRDCSLDIDVWRDGRWISAGAIPPEASVTPFTRVVRIDAPDTREDSIRVRLTSLTDAWRIEDAGIDWSPVTPLESRVLAMRSAERGGATSAMAALSGDDARYAVVLPGERIDLLFDALPGREKGRVAYALDVSGYLHEWPPASETAVTGPMLPASSGTDRIAVVRHLIRHREALLPLVYRHWNKRPR